MTFIKSLTVDEICGFVSLRSIFILVSHILKHRPTHLSIIPTRP